MRTDEERIALLHRRARKLCDQRRSGIWGGISAGLFMALIMLIVRIDVPLQSVLSSGYAASSLLGESAGGYVLVAVISFIAAVCITVYCIRKRNG